MSAGGSFYRFRVGDYRFRVKPGLHDRPRAQGDAVDIGRLRGSAFSGARWFAVSRVLIEVTNFLSVIPIARLIDPHEQGQAAVALVFPLLASILTYEGFGSALVQRRHVDDLHYRTAMTLSLLTGVLLTALIDGFALTAGRTVFGGTTAHLVVLSSATFLISSLTITSRAKMMRRLSFRLMARNDAALSIAGTVAVIGFALLGFGAVALVLGAIASSLADLGLQFGYALPARPGFSRRAAREIFGFGSFASATGVVLVLTSNVDYLILGAVLTSAQVGIYYRAYQFGANYQNKVTVVLQRMMFPLLSRASDDADVRRVRERAVEFNAMTALPFLGLIVVLAPEIVPLLFGPHWDSAVRPTQILCVAGMVTAITSGADATAMALGKQGRLFVIAAIFLVTYASAILIASQYGLIAACIAAAAAHLLMMVLTQHYLVDKLLGFPWTQLVRDTGPAFGCTGLAMAAVEALMVLEGGHVPPVARAASGLLVGIVVYALSFRALFPTRSQIFAGVLTRVVRRERPTPAPPDVSTFA